MTIKKFDKAGVAEFEQDLESFLEVLEDHCGVKISSGKSYKFLIKHALKD